MEADSYVKRSGVVVVDEGAGASMPVSRLENIRAATLLGRSYNSDTGSKKAIAPWGRNAKRRVLWSTGAERAATSTPLNGPGAPPPRVQLKQTLLNNSLFQLYKISYVAVLEWCPHV